MQHVFIDHDTDLIDVTLTVASATKVTKDAETGTTKQQDVAVVSHGSHAPPTSTETIHTTEKHPWLTTKGWIKAGDLHLGDRVLRLDGTTATVTKLVVVPGAQEMWDLTVSNVHTFAVGDAQFVVHNTTTPCVTGSYSQVRRIIGRDPALAGNQSHHILQDAMMRDLPGYSYGGAPAINLFGAASDMGTQHFLATQEQEAASAAFRASGRPFLLFSEAQDVGRRALMAAGYTAQEADSIVAWASGHFTSRFNPALLNRLRVPR